VEKGLDVWKAVWALEVPNPAKLFIWGPCNNLLPTRVNLFNKRVVVVKNCPCCNVEEEISFLQSGHTRLPRMFGEEGLLVSKNATVRVQIFGCCLSIVWKSLVGKILTSWQ
jgi:hypothetical protein